MANQLTFEQVLEKFKAASTDSMTYARMAAVMALEHFAEHGNLVRCQQFLDVLSENNYVKRSRMSFVRWLVTYAPIKVEQGHLTKDRNREDEIDLDGAKKTPFWELAPPRDITEFSSQDIVVELKRVISRFRGDRRVASDEDALAALNTADVAINAFAKQIAA